MKKINLLVVSIFTILLLACSNDDKEPGDVPVPVNPVTDSIPDDPNPDPKPEPEPNPEPNPDPDPEPDPEPNPDPVDNKSTHALLVIDMQNDFCNDGSLQVGKNPNEIIPYINDLIKSDKFSEIVFSQDWHPQNHKSFASNHEGKKVFDVIKLGGVDQVLWPNHCVQGKPGAEFHKDVVFKDSFKVIQKGTNVEVDSYSAFRDNSKNQKTELDTYLKEKNIKEVTVVGLALDYCVKFTCIDAIENGYKVNMHLKGSAAVNAKPEDGENAIKQLKEIGVNIIE